MAFLEKMKRFLKHKRNENDISYEEAVQIMEKYPETILVDVRSTQEYNENHLPLAISIPVYDIKKITKIIKNRDNIIILYCQTGARSKKAQKVLEDLCYTNIYTINKGLNG